MHAIQQSIGRILNCEEIGYLIHLQNIHDDVAEDCYRNKDIDFNDALAVRLRQALDANELPQELSEVLQ